MSSHPMSAIYRHLLHFQIKQGAGYHVMVVADKVRLSATTSFQHRRIRTPNWSGYARAVRGVNHYRTLLPLGITEKKLSHFWGKRLGTLMD